MHSAGQLTPQRQPEVIVNPKATSDPWNSVQKDASVSRTDVRVSRNSANFGSGGRGDPPTPTLGLTLQVMD